MKQLGFFLLLGLSVLLSACDKGKKVEDKVEQTFTVKQEVLRKTLYFSGTIEPIKKTAVTAPVNSVIERLLFTYGAKVKRGSDLIELNSIELQKNYNETLTAFLKAKDQYAVAKAKFVGTEELFKAGLISKNSYVSERSTLENNRVALLQARYKLSSLLDKIAGNDLQYLMDLDLSDIEKLKIALNKNYNLITLKAPTSGIVLYPPKGGGDEKSADVAVGAELKSGQVIALIGDLMGLSLNINVTEVEIDKIRVGLPARVKGVAFPNQIMKGYVSSVNSQASSTAGSSGGFPIFNAVVNVPKLNKEQRNLVKVGMSASIEVDIETKDVLLVPIKAVYREGTKSLVKLKTATGIKPQAISTGVTTVDKVVVNSGLKEGDVIVYE